MVISKLFGQLLFSLLVGLGRLHRPKLAPIQKLLFSFCFYNLMILEITISNSFTKYRFIMDTFQSFREAR
jgi:hypothetical protein